MRRRMVVMAGVLLGLATAGPVLAQQAGGSAAAVSMAPAWSRVAAPAPAMLPAPTGAVAERTPAGGVPGAQVPAADPVTTAAIPADARFSPVVDGRLLAAPVADRPLVHAPAYRREGVPLMIVGGALFLAGAIIDSKAGDAVMVGGVVVAAVGLLEYLQ